MIVNEISLGIENRMTKNIGWPPIVNINKNRSPKNAEVVFRCNNGGFPRYVDNQLKIFVPVGKDIKIVTPVK